MDPMPQNHVLYGEWRRIKVLGSGGFGQVSLWENINTHEKIAMKMCKQQLQDRPLERWKKEVEIMKNLDHPSIVSFRQVPQFIQDRYVINHVALGMEYCENGDLRKMLSDAANCCGLAEYQVRDLLHNIGSAVHYLHSKSIIHRDLKPENIVIKSVGQQPTKLQYKIIDLGYAKDLSEHSCGTSFVGTLHYLAPEFFSDQLRYSKTVDFWSFGLLAFECITGRRPFFPHLEVMQYMQVLKDKKKDEHICTVNDGSSGSAVQFLSKIPQPYALNPIFVEKMGCWLQDMLKYDPARRGGGSRGDGWYNSLQTILNEKHVPVYNTSANSLITVVVGANMGMRRFQEEIGKQTRITAENQILLFKDGGQPDPTKRAVDQCWKAPSQDDWVVYLYSERDDYNVPNNTLPRELASVVNDQRSQLHSKKLRRILCLATNFVYTQCLACKQSMAALFAIANSVQRRHVYFTSCIRDLTRISYTFSGILEHYERGLDADIQLYNEYEETMGFEQDELIQQWYLNKEEIPNYQSVCSQVNESALTSANTFVNVNALTKKAFDLIETTNNLISEKGSMCKKKYEDMKKKIRQLADFERPSDHDQRSDKDSQNVNSMMKDLVTNFISPLMDQLKNLSAESRDQRKKLVAILNQLGKHVAESVEARQSINSRITTLQQKQAQRQKTLWELVCWYKEQAEQMNACFYEVCQSTTDIHDTGLSGISKSLELTTEMGQHRERFQCLVDDLVQDENFSLSRDLDWGYLCALSEKEVPVIGDESSSAMLNTQDMSSPSNGELTIENNLPPTHNGDDALPPVNSTTPPDQSSTD